MAFKYQPLNDSRSSLNSLSSLGSSRSIDSPGATGGGGGRQRPRLEFSAAGTCGSANNRNSVAIMTEVMERSSSLYPAPLPPPSSRGPHKQPEVERHGEGVGVKSDSNWRQWLQVEEGDKTSKGGTFADGSTTDTGTSHTKSSTVLKRKNRGDFSDSTDAPNTQQNTTYSSSVESETGLYIHSSVRSGGSGLKFSRQLSTASAGGDRQPLTHHHHHHHINQGREHGKLFRVLQKFSNKRAQQRVDVESEKRARKSPQHSSSGGNRTERGRDKENVGHQKRSHGKNKQGKKGASSRSRFPVSKSSDLLSGFSDVVYHDINTEVIDSPAAADQEVEPDTIIYANTTTDRLLGGEEYSSLSRAHLTGSRAQKYLSMPPAYEIDREDDGGGASRYERASVRRTSSLNEGVYHGCGGATLDLDVGVLATKPSVVSSSRNGSRRKSHDLLLCQGES